MKMGYTMRASSKEGHTADLQGSLIPHMARSPQKEPILLHDLRSDGCPLV